MAPDPLIRELMAAGSAAVEFNAPLGPERARAIAGRLAADRVEAVVDLGCGRGALARLVAAALPPGATVVGVDTDGDAIEAARIAATEADLTDRLRFEVADAAGWSGPVDAAISVGASHAVGTQAELLDHLAGLVQSGTAVVGEGVWVAEPDRWCLDTFGEHPHGLEAMAELASARGWTVAGAELSTLQEWDDFERGWTDGVQAVGTDAAIAFADERAAEYQRYRGVLGFGWLHLRR